MPRESEIRGEHILSQQQKIVSTKDCVKSYGLPCWYKSIELNGVKTRLHYICIWFLKSLV